MPEISEHQLGHCTSTGGSQRDPRAKNKYEENYDQMHIFSKLKPQIFKITFVKPTFCIRKLDLYKFTIANQCMPVHRLYKIQN